MTSSINTNSQERIQVTYWPTCQDAIAWDGDDVAVAAGEVVYLLTPNDHDHDFTSQQWQKHLLRVNQFGQADWPLVKLATLKDASIGEEQSESSVIALSWSTAGLGLYTRSVLSILTSNLLLSFWETNGNPGVWQRTCVVNNALRSPLTNQLHSSRRALRFRSFLWLPKITHFTDSKWGTHLLILADDNQQIHVCRVRKEHVSAYGTWTINLLASRELEIPPQSHLQSRPTLRHILATSSPVSKLETTNWVISDFHDGASSVANLQVKVSFGQVRKAQYLSLVVQRSGRVDDTHEPESEILVNVTGLERLSHGRPLIQSPPTDIFSSQIQACKSEFSDNFNLGGRVLVRNWGTAFSDDCTKAATCVTLHPSDMLDSTSPAHQRTWVLFKKLKAPTQVHKVETEMEAIRKILQVVAGTSPDMIKTTLDKHIVFNTVNMVNMYFQDISDLVDWARSASSTLLSQPKAASIDSQIQTEEDETAMNVDQITRPEPKTDEMAPFAGQHCDICTSSIPFGVSARCTKGHSFTRCNLTFVVIQEPGISMFCARCGKQFLDPGKTELPDGPSLSRILFSEFDVCPYCQGKYRGQI